MVRRLLVCTFVLGTIGVSLPLFGQACTGLCLQQTSCSGTATTSISGVVYAPNGVDPLPNALVYVPNSAVLPFTDGASCDSAGEPVSGSPLVSAVTGTDGSFTLTNMPVGTNIPLVIQSGRWRRQVTIPTVSACVNTAVAASLSRMPTNKSEGDIPLIALVTGASDAIECTLRKVGIADSEFTNPGGGGRVNIFVGGGKPGAEINSSTPVETQLENTESAISAYDMVMLACQGGQYNQTSALQQNMINYANAGGRIFATHYGYVWLYNDAPFSGVADWAVKQATLSDQNATVDMTFPKGQQLAQWLVDVGASTTLGQIPITYLKQDQNGVVAPTQSWLTATSNSNASVVQQFTFNTPVGTAANQQCGRVLYNEYHVDNASITAGTKFPTECPGGAMSPQEKLLEYSLFDRRMPSHPMCRPLPPSV